MRISVHIYNCSDKKKGTDHIYFEPKTRTVNPTASKSRFRHVAGVTHQKIQKMWQDQLPLRRGERSRKLLSFCQYSWQKPHHDLCLSQKPRQGQTCFNQLPDCSKHPRRNQYNQSRSISSKGNNVGRRLCLSKWKPPP